MNSDSKKTFRNFPGKSFLKGVRWKLRRSIAGYKYGFDVVNSAPKIFGNAMPKSGSHLLTQVLEGFSQLGPFIDPGFPPINRSEANLPISPEEVLNNITKMRPGDMRYGYIHAVEPYLSILTQSDWATLFIYRDPRDMLISHIFYATVIKQDHGMHRYYTEKMFTMSERINAAIKGVSEIGYELASVSNRYQSYIGWLDKTQVLSIKFEDLILTQETTLNRILQFLMDKGAPICFEPEEAINIIKRHIIPEKSGTFRKGVPGSWKDHFTEENKSLFKRKAGDLLIQLGYEKDNGW